MLIRAFDQFNQDAGDVLRRPLPTGKTPIKRQQQTSSRASQSIFLETNLSAQQVPFARSASEAYSSAAGGSPCDSK